MQRLQQIELVEAALCRDRHTVKAILVKLMQLIGDFYPELLLNGHCRLRIFIDYFSETFKCHNF